MNLLPNPLRILDEERDFDPKFFEYSPYRSPMFIMSTVLLSLDFGIAVLAGVALWPKLAWGSEECMECLCLRCRLFGREWFVITTK